MSLCRGDQIRNEKQKNKWNASWPYGPIQCVHTCTFPKSRQLVSYKPSQVTYAIQDLGNQWQSFLPAWGANDARPYSSILLHLFFFFLFLFLWFSLAPAFYVGDSFKSWLRWNYKGRVPERKSPYPAYMIVVYKFQKLRFLGWQLTRCSRVMSPYSELNLLLVSLANLIYLINQTFWPRFVPKIHISRS